MEIRPILSALLRNKTGAILVALQVAISLAILANALHIVNLRQAVSARSSGLADESTLFYISIDHLQMTGYNEQLALQNAEAATLRAVAGITSVALTSQMPMSNLGSTYAVLLDPKQQRPSANAAEYLSPDSLVKTWGLKLVEGRDLAPDEVPQHDAPPPTISILVTKALAKKLWPGASTFVGKNLFLGSGEDARVVGVIGQLQSQGAELAESGYYAMILPIKVVKPRGIIFTIRVEQGQLDRVMKEAQAALRAAAPGPVILKLRTVAEDRKQRYRADTALAWMLITVSVLLLLITASGIVGMASLWVTQRRKQIGVRRALGARRVDILRYFITENCMITSLGVLGGVLLGIALNQLLVEHLEMAKLPLAYLLGGTGVFWALGIVAVYGPAWRAATISPATATRSA